MNKKKYAIVVLSVIVLIITISIIVIINSKKTKKQLVLESNEKSITNSEMEKIGLKENIIKEVAEQKEKITPNTYLKFEQYYKDCGHTVIDREKVKEELVNKNIEEIENIYKDWEIKELNNKEIILYKEFKGECNEHYLLRDANGVITIYRIDNNGDEILIEPTEISTKYLPKTDKDKLQNGVRLNGKEELNAYIEDFE